MDMLFIYLLIQPTEADADKSEVLNANDSSAPAMKEQQSLDTNLPTDVAPIDGAAAEITKEATESTPAKDDTNKGKEKESAETERIEPAETEKMERNNQEDKEQSENSEQSEDSDESSEEEEAAAAGATATPVGNQVATAADDWDDPSASRVKPAVAWAKPNAALDLPNHSMLVSNRLKSLSPIASPGSLGPLVSRASSGGSINA
jgi:hypothetical protein